MSRKFMKLSQLKETPRLLLATGLVHSICLPNTDIT